jgi:hypothetical protein
MSDKTKCKIINCLISIVILLISVITAALLAYRSGKQKGNVIAVDFTVESFVKDEREPKYKFLPAEVSNYICDMCDELGMDSDLTVARLIVENPEFNPEVTHRNENGTIDVGLFQLNDYYLWTTFKTRYWFDNIQLDPFNWKHNTYIALHHMKYLDDKFKVRDDAIMAYNCGEGNVMNGTIPASTEVYLAKVKNNLFLLKGSSND